MRKNVQEEQSRMKIREQDHCPARWPHSSLKRQVKQRHMYECGTKHGETPPALSPQRRPVGGRGVLTVTDISISLADNQCHLAVLRAGFLRFTLLTYVVNQRVQLRCSQRQPFTIVWRSSQSRSKMSGPSFSMTPSARWPVADAPAVAAVSADSNRSAGMLDKYRSPVRVMRLFRHDFEPMRKAGRMYSVKCDLKRTSFLSVAIKTALF